MQQLNQKVRYHLLYHGKAHSMFRWMLKNQQFGGWTIIRNEVLRLFGPVCKDPEYTLFLNLLDEIIPLIFYIYSTVFRGGDLQQWLDALLRMSLVFITFRRRNYDKATLCQLSDLVYHIRENRALPAIENPHWKEGWDFPLCVKKVGTCGHSNNLQWLDKILIILNYFQCT